MTDAQPLEIELRFRDLIQRGLAGAQRRLLRFTKRVGVGFKAMTRAAAGLKRALLSLPAILTAIVTGGIAVLAKSMINAASAAEQTASRFQIVFGDIAKAAEETARRVAEANGRAVSDIQESMSDFALILKEAGLDGPALEAASAALSQRALDLDSIHDATQKGIDVSNALRTALVGEQEAVKRLGIFFNDNLVKTKAWELGLADLGQELTENQKIIARLAILMEAQQDANANNIITQEEYANVVKRVKSQVKGLREEMGQRLIAAIRKAIQSIGGEAAVLDMLRIGFEFVVKAVEVFLDAAVGIVKIGQHVVQSLGGMEGALDKIGTASEVAGAGVKLFLRSVEATVIVTRGLWNILQFLGVLIAHVFVVVVDQAVSQFVMWVKVTEKLVEVLKDGLVVTLDFVVGKFQEMLTASSKALRFLGKFAPIGGEKLNAMAAAADQANVALGGIRTGILALGDVDTGMDEIIADATKLREQLQIMKQYTLESLKIQLDDLADTWDMVGMSMEDTPLVATRDKAADVAAALEILDLNLQDVISGMGDLDGSSADSVPTQLKQFISFAKDMDKQLDQFAAGSLQNFTNGLSSAFADFATGAATAKEAFTSFAVNFVAQTIQMIAQMMILRALTGVFFGTGGVIPGGTGTMIPVEEQFATGGVAKGGLSNAVPIVGYAQGGPLFTRPHMAIVGEGQFNEAVVPLPDGRSIPVDMRGDSDGATINFNVQTIDASSFDSYLTERRRTIEDVVASGMTARRSFRTTMQGEIV